MEMKKKQTLQWHLEVFCNSFSQVCFPEAGGPAMMILASQGEHQQKQRFFGLCGI